nr:nsp11 [Tylonycteris bat coronavirus HKU4]
SKDTNFLNESGVLV